MLGTPSLTANAIVMGDRVQNFRCRQPEGSRSSGKLCPKSIRVKTGPPSGFNTLAPAAPKMPADQADGSGEHDACNQEVSNSPSHSTLAHLTTIFAARHLHVRYSAGLILAKSPPTIAGS